MNKNEFELLKIFDKAIYPDKLHARNPGAGGAFTPKVTSKIIESELENYSHGLENSLILLQCENNHLKEKVVQNDREIRCLKNELQALQWQIEYDRNLLKEIKTSRSWMIARALHALVGMLTLNRSTMRELKNDIDDFLLQESNSQDKYRSKMAQIMHLLFRRVFQAAKGIGLEKFCCSAMPAAELVSEKKLVYGSFYQEDEKFTNLPEDIKTVVFYLPQYHTFPENDEWWGKGFTEWVNTRKALPRFPGHYQPRTPHKDIGYYCLAEIETLKRQAEMARKHGIDYFCFYYYWFDGKKLMEKPLELLMAHPEIPMNFCLCWANENWTRAWDGQQKSVLIQQNYSDENDINFIRDLKKYIVDPRYMRSNGKPVILVYHAKIMPDPDKTFSVWRKWCRQNGVGEICIWSCRTFIKGNEFKKFTEVDREVEFPPHMVTDLEMFPAADFAAYKDDGYYYNYQKIISDLKAGKTMADNAPYPFYRCAMLGWDNSSRRQSGYSVWQYFSLKDYHYWLRKNIEYTQEKFLPGDRFIFINAWNEWAEGTYLEPDERYGYASLNTTTRALCDLPAIPDYQVLEPDSEILEQPGRILIHLHVYYPDLCGEFACYLNQMPFEYDCIITTDCRQKRSLIKKILTDVPLEKCREWKVKVVSNCGRDVAPFFAAVTEKVVEKYDFIGHFHTKKSLTVEWGDEWRHYLLDNLLGRTEYINSVFKRFERDSSLGLFFPTPYPAMRDYMNWENNKERCEKLLTQMHLSVSLPDKPVFPVGQMFWARSKAVAPLFKGIIRNGDFEEENAQVSDTLAHALERIWKYVAEGNGFTSLAGVFPPVTVRKAVSCQVRRLAVYIHYSSAKVISAADWYMLQELKKSADIVFVNNGQLPGKELKRVGGLVKKVIVRENRGYDFGAWRDALKEIDLTGYEELILLNNSILGPFYSFDTIFDRMAQSTADFWGMSEFPLTVNPRREEAKALPNGIIPKHIQSYFMVFKKQVFVSDAFKTFWKNVQDETSLPNVVARYETRLSNLLEEAGFKSDVFLKTAQRLQEVDKITPEYNAIYCRPQDFLVLGFPFLKKNICYYMKQSEINETIHLVSRLYDYPVKNIKIINKTR